jgi:acyl carrier protein phosphodiesterase
MFSGNKDVDNTILIEIKDEKDFLSFCSTNKYVSSLCKSDMIYRARLEKHYPDIFVAKPKFKNWRTWYLKNMKAIGELKERYQFEWKTGVPSIYLSILDHDLSDPNTFIQMMGKYGYLDIVYNQRVQQELNNEDSPVPQNFDVLSYFAWSFTLPRLKEQLELVKDVVQEIREDSIQTAIANCAEFGNYENYIYLVNRFGLAYEQIETIANRVGNGNNTKILSDFLRRVQVQSNDETVAFVIGGLLEKNHTRKAYELWRGMKQISKKSIEHFLNKCAYYDNLDFIKELLEEMGTIPGLSSILYKAIRWGSMKVARYLSENGVSVDSQVGFDDLKNYEIELWRREIKENIEKF